MKIKLSFFFENSHYIDNIIMILFTIILSYFMWIGIFESGMPEFICLIFALGIYQIPAILIVLSKLRFKKKKEAQHEK